MTEIILAKLTIIYIIIGSHVAMLSLSLELKSVQRDTHIFLRRWPPHKHNKQTNKDENLTSSSNVLKQSSVDF